MAMIVSIAADDMSAKLITAKIRKTQSKFNLNNSPYRKKRVISLSKFMVRS